MAAPPQRGSSGKCSLHCAGGTCGSIQRAAPLQTKLCWVALECDTRTTGLLLQAAFTAGLLRAHVCKQVIFTCMPSCRSFLVDSSCRSPAPVHFIRPSHFSMQITHAECVIQPEKLQQRNGARPG